MPIRYLAAAIVALLLAPHAAAQYSLTATATATGSPDDVDATSTGANVFAVNNGGSPGADNPSTVSTNASGSPNAAFCFAFAAAESSGPSGLGTGFASLRSLNDVVAFDASTQFTARVSFDLDHAITTNWSNDFGRVEASASLRRVLASGATMGTPGFAYTEVATNNSTTVSVDRRDPIEIEMQPGDALRVGLSLVTTATARASFNISDGSVRADAVCRLYIEVISGTASIAGSLSGAEYGPPPCNVADLADPLGVLDLSDINAFVSAFTAQDPAADLDGSGVFDLADINAFVAAFSGGCP